MLDFKLFTACQSEKKRRKGEKIKNTQKKENEMKNKMLAWLVTSIIYLSALLRPIQWDVYFNMVSWDGMAE